MDSTEHEETQENQPQLDSTEKPGRSPLIVRRLVIVLFIVVLIGIYSQRKVVLL